MHCSIVAAFAEMVPKLASSWFKAWLENSETVRRFKARAEIAEKKRLELEQKYDEAQLENQALRSENKALRKELAAVKILTTAGFALYMIYHPYGAPFFVSLLILGMVHFNTLVDLAVVLGIQLLPMTSGLKKYVTQGLRLGTRLWQFASPKVRALLGHLVQSVERIHRRIRDWKWKSVPVSRSFNTAP